MGVEQVVREFVEKQPAQSFSYEDRARIAEELALKETTVGWALWNLARKGTIKQWKKDGKTYFQAKQ